MYRSSFSLVGRITKGGDVYLLATVVVKASLTNHDKILHWYSLFLQRKNIEPKWGWIAKTLRHTFTITNYQYLYDLIHNSCHPLRGSSEYEILFTQTVQKHIYYLPFSSFENTWSSYFIGCTYRIHFVS